jgi:predicted enzyme related to lactoylglutathione lyase
MKKKNALNWFEIPTIDFDRAKNFYETILEEPLNVSEEDEMKFGIFEYDMENGVGGCIIKNKLMKPVPGGIFVYLNVEGKLDEVISRVANAGGKVLKDRTAIPSHGFIATLQDTEGNIVGIHSMA